MSIRLQPVDLSTIGWVPTTLEADHTENGKKEASDPVLGTPLKKLTTKDLNGNGAFDVLMHTTKLHLQEEFEAGRITGADYTTVYLGALSAVLQTATQFLMNEQQAQLVTAQVGLVRQQTVTELANTDDNIPEGLGFNHVRKVPVAIPPVDFPGGTL